MKAHADDSLDSLDCEPLVRTVTGQVAISRRLLPQYRSFAEQKKARFEAIMNRWCNNVPLTPEMFNGNEGRTKSGLLLKAIKGFKIRLYGFDRNVMQLRTFLIVEIDSEKKQNKADPRVLKRAKGKSMKSERNRYVANVSDIQKDAIFAEEDFVVEAQTFLHGMMLEKGVSRSELARAMGVSRARISQIFSDDCKNFTVRSLARAVHALGEAPRLSCKRSQTHGAEDSRIRLLDPEDIESVWNIQSVFSELRQHTPCNDQSPTRLVGYDFSPQEWEAA